ncbi:YeiH family protein [Aquipuribacter sp. MA13-6]|uniref:YeiH family protein n=1 Tax=unclassified Aquipuribacter TaxID=2635084 RepID=UPI003EECB032
MNGPAEPSLRAPQPGGVGRVLPGLLLALVVAALATGLDRLLGPATGSPGSAVLALVLGLVLTAVRAPGPRAGPGLAWASGRLLQAGIVLLGLTVPVSSLLEVGPRALPVVVAAVATAFLVGSLLGRALGVGRDLRTLVSAGTGICGASAIAATAGVLRARPADVSYALSVVVLMNLVAILTLPVAARGLGLSDEGFGAWVGSSVNDTSAVVALAGGWGGSALAVAVVVKLTRVLALVPVTLVLARLNQGSGAGRRLVPPFLLLFVLAVVVAATGVVPDAVAQAVALAVDVLITWALAAVGCSTRLRDVTRAGWAPVVLAAAVWFCVAAAALAVLVLVGLA